MSKGDFTGKVRVRVNGLLQYNNALLLVKLPSPITGKDIWIPPGGGVDFRESLTQTLLREMKEETGLQVIPGPLRYIHEVIHSSVHAVEFYYDVSAHYPETAKLGGDPEFTDEQQYLKDLRFIPVRELEQYPVVPEYLRKNFVFEARVKKPIPLQLTSYY